MRPGFDYIFIEEVSSSTTLTTLASFIPIGLAMSSTLARLAVARSFCNRLLVLVIIDDSNGLALQLCKLLCSSSTACLKCPPHRTNTRNKGRLRSLLSLLHLFLDYFILLTSVGSINSSA